MRCMRWLPFAVSMSVACSSSPATSPTATDAVVDAIVGDAASPEAAADGDAAPVVVRGARYCEILVGFLAGTDVRLEVWNTFGLGDCPQEVWTKVDAAAVKAERSADAIVLNGPRYWAFD